MVFELMVLVMIFISLWAALTATGLDFRAKFESFYIFSSTFQLPFLATFDCSVILLA